MSESISDLEKDIEQSRARLDETIDQIQGRLNASSLVDEMLGSARRTPYSGFYDDALDAVKRNPVPVLLIAAGVGLLLNSMRSPRRPASRALVPVEIKPVTVTGADRTYDPDAPGGRPTPDLPPERQI